MDATTITKFKKTLLELHETVKKDIEDLKESSKPIKPENSLGRLTRMDAIGQKSINDHALNNAKIRLKKIEAALKRIEDDEYGFCLECGDEISEKRLNAVPESPQCMECME
jgi:DnaK suppressor protein